jgi:predicted SAM-dependent methyltransferase
MKLNLGCGRDYKKGWVNCDWSADVHPDKIVDMNKKLPFKDSTVDEILMSHVLEHFQKPIEILRELYRVCRNGAVIHIRVPYFSSESAFSMMDHYSFYTWTTFDFLEKNHVCHWQGFGDFKILYKKIKWRKQLWLLEKIFGLCPRVYQEFFCWWFPAKELVVDLKVIKN